MHKAAQGKPISASSLQQLRKLCYSGKRFGFHDFKWGRITDENMVGQTSSNSEGIRPGDYECL
tara:strand:- start:1362 stop:1550 length:189 start_codon:yes stop_codon:yes gene_type:complete